MWKSSNHCRHVCHQTALPTLSSPALYKPQNINRRFLISSSDRSPKCGSQVITAGTCAIRRHFRLSSSPARYKPRNINRRFSNSSSDRSPKCGSQVITLGTFAIWTQLWKKEPLYVILKILYIFNPILPLKSSTNSLRITLNKVDKEPWKKHHHIMASQLR